MRLACVIVIDSAEIAVAPPVKDSRFAGVAVEEYEEIMVQEFHLKKSFLFKHRR